MELAIKKENSESKSFDFSAANLLVYLKTFDIKEDIFNIDKRYTDLESQVLKRYYDEKRQTADRLVIESEYVGKTYDNLDIIKSKFMKRM